MSKENKPIELKDKELEKITDGISPDTDGNYVVTKGDWYRQTEVDGPGAQSYYIVLESKTTKDVNDGVYVCKIQATGLGTLTSDVYRTISYLNTCEYKGKFPYDPHELH